MNTSDVPAPNGPSTSNLSVRLRGGRPPPQAFEGDVERLYNRLIDEGADIGTAMILRWIIFADGVTIDALMAPIETPEIVRAFDGATRMWGLLLETKETVTGKKKYCARMKIAASTATIVMLFGILIRITLGSHFRAVTGESTFRNLGTRSLKFHFRLLLYSTRQFSKNSERKIHGRKCKFRPAVSA